MIVRSKDIWWLVYLLFTAFVLYMGRSIGFITLVAVWSMATCIVVLPKIKLDIESLLLISFTFTYTLGGILNGFFSDLSTVVASSLPIIFFYWFGKFLVIKTSSDKGIIWVLLIFILCYPMKIYLTIISDILESGSILNLSRTFVLEDDNALSATQVGITCSLGFVGFPLFFVMRGSGLRWGYLLAGLLSLATTVFLINRTGLIIMFLTLFIVLWYYYKKKRLLLLCGFLLLIVLVLIFFSNMSVFTDIISAYSARNDVDAGTAGDRIPRWIDAIYKLIRYPAGWFDLDGGENYYIHNMWLDIARVSGIISFILLVLSTLRPAKMLLKLIRNQIDQVVALLLALYICFFLSCFVEPVYGGLHLFLFAMLWGVIQQFYHNTLASPLINK